MVTLDQLKAIAPNAKYVTLGSYLPFLSNALDKYNINTPSRLAAFFSQVAHESCDFNYVKEIASGKEYDTGKKAIDLGNTPEADGDGEFFKGRGLIQITGRNNYKACSVALFGNECLLKTPALLESPQYAVLSACWFWDKVKNLNLIADKPEDWHKPGPHNYSKFQWITILINGGLNGYTDRLQKYEVAKKVFNVQP